MKKKKVLVIVAHPDDEIIWMGGSLIRNSLFKRNWDVTIISLCRKNDKNRMPKFFKICEILNAKEFISDLDDSEHGYYKKISSEDIIKRIKGFIQEDYDYVFSHNENGEYGHIRHKQVGRAVKFMVNNKIIICKRFFVFAYVRKAQECYIDKSATNFINLKKNELLKKKELIERIYGFQKGSFEERNCRESESFNEIK